MSMKQYLLLNRGKLTIAVVVLFFVPAFLWTYLTQIRIPENTISFEESRETSGNQEMDVSFENQAEPVLSDAAVKSNGPSPLGPVTFGSQDYSEETTTVLPNESSVEGGDDESIVVNPFNKAKKSAKVFDVSKFFQRNTSDDAFDASELRDAIRENVSIVESVIEEAPIENISEQEREEKIIVNSKEPVASGVSIITEVVENVQPETAEVEENLSETTRSLPEERQEDSDDEYDPNEQATTTSSEEIESTLEESPEGPSASSETEEPLPTTTTEETPSELEIEVTTTLEMQEEPTSYTELYSRTYKRQKASAVARRVAKNLGK